MTNPSFLGNEIRDKVSDIPMITEEDLKAFENPTITEDYVEPSEVLQIKPTDDIPILCNLHFGWLNPDRRRRVGMGHWRWVNGELAKLVRLHGIIREAIGGSSATDLVTNGDLILGFMPREMYQKRKEYLRNKNQQLLSAVRTQERAGGQIDARHQELQPDVKVRATYAGQDVGQ